MKNKTKTNPCTPYPRAPWKLPTKSAQYSQYGLLTMTTTTISRGVMIYRVWSIDCIMGKEWDYGVNDLGDYVIKLRLKSAMCWCKRLPCEANAVARRVKVISIN
jgi:hypothetical protein